MKKRFKLYINIALILLVLQILTGCMTINSNYRIYSNGEYEFNLKVMIPEKIANSANLNLENYKQMFIDELGLSNDIITDISEVKNGKNYVGLEIIRPRGQGQENQKIKIDINRKENKISFEMDDIISEDVWISLDALDLGYDSKEQLKKDGMEIIVTIQMPGDILSANVGEINGDILTCDLIENQVTNIIVTSKLSNILPMMIIMFIIITTIIAALILLYINNNRHKKKKNKKNSKVETQNKTNKKVSKHEIKEDNDILETLLLENQDDEWPY